MNSLIQALPGITLSVPEVTRQLSEMWSGESTVSSHFHSQERASQLNIVIHFGLETSEKEAQQIFTDVVTFAQRYPCRIIVLCPMDHVEQSKQAFDAKLYSSCFIGEDLRKQCCCEALILGYSINEPKNLQNQLTLWLETDLPIYYWFHRVKPHRIVDHYLHFSKMVSRVIYDSAIEGDTYQKINWPKIDILSDLARARILVVRQSIGQFLSGYPVALLAENLDSVNISYSSEYLAEANCLTDWVNYCLQDFALPQSVDCHISPMPQKKNDLGLDFHYRDQKMIQWRYQAKESHGSIKTNIGSAEKETSVLLRTVKPDEALSEALFFGLNS